MKNEKLHYKDDLLPGFMYSDENDNDRFCYIGNNGTGYPLTFLIFFNDPIYHPSYDKFIEWASWMTFKPLNITLRDYIIQHEDLVIRTLLSFQLKNFSSGPNSDGTSIEMINELEKKLLEDIDIQYYKNIKNYNL